MQCACPCFGPARCHFYAMCRSILRSFLAATLLGLAGSALAANYPASGKWGVGAPRSNDPIDCTNLRVIAFNGDQRTDSKGGVPAYRNVSVTASGASYRVSDQFTTGQISNAHVNYTLRQVDANHLDMMQGGTTLKLQRCK
jgi:hypothetical protein